mmetsp:Transcript_10607/g.23551  ORF Transcript_10607/g.23551 Transcript_10607/m.23551 type:complete len:609 (-) Transcript_10607:3-1829(-)
MDNQLVHVIRCVILFKWCMHSCHELVFGAEWNLCNHGGTFLDTSHINITKVCSTKNRQFSRVSNFTLSSTILAKSTFGTQNTTTKHLANKGRVGAFTSRFILGFSFSRGVFSSSIRAGFINFLFGTFIGSGRVHGLGDTKTKAALASSSALSLRGRTFLDDLTSLQVLGVVSTFMQVGVVDNKVLRFAFTGIDIKPVSLLRGDKGGQGHFILGQGTGLVGANCSHTAKSFHSRKSPNNGILFGHVRHSPSIGHCHDGFQSLWDHGNGTHKGGGERINTRFISDEEGHKPCAQGGNGNEESKPLGYSINLLQHVGLLLFNLGHKSIDGTNLSFITSSNYKANSGSLRHKGGRKAHVVSISKRDSLRVSTRFNGISGLVNGDSFTSQGSFKGRQVGYFQHAQISRDTVTQVKLHNISRNNIGSWNLDILSITNKQGITGKHTLQSLSSLFCRTFLDDSNCCVQYNHQGNDSNLDPVRNNVFAIVRGDRTCRRDDGYENKDSDQHITDLGPNLLQQSNLFLLTELVFTIFFETGISVGRCKTRFGNVLGDAKFREAFFFGVRVPRVNRRAVNGAVVFFAHGQTSMNSTVRWYSRFDRTSADEQILQPSILC